MASSCKLPLLCPFVSTAAVTEGSTSVRFSALSSAVVEDSVSARLAVLSSSAVLPCSCQLGITGVIVGNAGNCFLQRTPANCWDFHAGIIGCVLLNVGNSFRRQLFQEYRTSGNCQKCLRTKQCQQHDGMKWHLNLPEQTQHFQIVLLQTELDDL